ncbi:hypothetical protein [Paraburkholderia sp. BL17N1]|uniref:hypothetical protein n=1 Tax=Paraburkholderia sp. BL17N1 TaxID=1938798 RepID=UPI000F207E79|nr:hypothetical protein [Paraburkholderia sp. BL17N1]RKR45922.1 hypothetical protein B0G82_3587 [Paraburkholderia sp. BL17N1]
MELHFPLAHLSPEVPAAPLLVPLVLPHLTLVLALPPKLLHLMPPLLHLMLTLLLTPPRLTLLLHLKQQPLHLTLPLPELIAALPHCDSNGLRRALRLPRTESKHPPQAPLSDLSAS